MENAEPHRLIRSLVEAFKHVPRPEPLCAYEGSHDDEEVAIFSSTDWENATYSDFNRGLEGWIICSPETKVYLTPKLIRILLLKRDAKLDDVADNLSFELLPYLQEPEVFGLLNYKQMTAVFDAVAYVDRTHWYPSRSDEAGKLARSWGLHNI